MAPCKGNVDETVIEPSGDRGRAAYGRADYFDASSTSLLVFPCPMPLASYLLPLASLLTGMLDSKETRQRLIFWFSGLFGGPPAGVDRTSLSG